MPSTSTLPSSSCLACILDCSCAACFIMPRRSAINASFELLLIVAVGVLGSVFLNMGFRRLGGKLAHLDHLGTGKARQPLLHPRIRFLGALALAPLDFDLRARRRLRILLAHDHGP